MSEAQIKRLRALIRQHRLKIAEIETLLDVMIREQEESNEK